MPAVPAINLLALCWLSRPCNIGLAFAGNDPDGVMYSLLIFDFDGTLADSYPFFLRVFNQLADEYGFQRLDAQMASELRHCDVRQMMQKVGMSPAKLPLVAARFIALMQQHVATVPLFDHVDETLMQLVKADLRLALVSSNSYANVLRILGPVNRQHMGWMECGMSVFGKAERIRKILRKTGVAKEAALYIGDQLTDLEAARQANIAFGAVSWGYASIESLCSQGPDEVFEQVGDLQKLTQRGISKT